MRHANISGIFEFADDDDCGIELAHQFRKEKRRHRAKTPWRSLSKNQWVRLRASSTPYALRGRNFAGLSYLHNCWLDDVPLDLTRKEDIKAIASPVFTVTGKYTTHPVSLTFSFSQSFPRRALCGKGSHPLRAFPGLD